MKQVLQNLRTGETTVTDVPAPGLGANSVLIQTRKTLISAGTEKMLLEFGRASLIGKAKAQPDKVKQVLDKIRTDGLMPTLETVFSRLDEPLPLGYSNAGVVLKVGRNVTEFKPGDRVISNGPHAEIVSVPKLLCAKIPDGVDDDQAAFTVLASIGLQGIRLAQPTLGEIVVVFGLGLIGLITTQMLIASGCNVIGIDINEQRLKLAERFGARTINGAVGSDPVSVVKALTTETGADAILITASAKTDDIVHQAAEMSRKRGRIVLVGIVGLNLRRSDFYEKELSFQVSCSYGPGRYDDLYEQSGQDYPLGFVRWTEQRNFGAIIDMLATSRLDLSALITHHYPIANAGEAYDTVRTDHAAMGVLLDYPEQVERMQSIAVPVTKPTAPTKKAAVALIGAGNFGKLVMGPALAKTGARLKYVSARTNAASATHLARKCGFENATTDLNTIWQDDSVNTVFISTRPNTHGPLACEALAAGKHVFVEKPMAINLEQVQQVINAVAAKPDLQYMVGFNRRFSPHIVKAKQLLAGRAEPLAMHFAANTGIIPADTWFQDTQVNGGRIIGEACHFIDLLVYLADSLIVTVAAAQMGENVAVQEDKMSIVLSFADGSIGTVNYFSNGAKSYPKEQVEVYTEGRVLRVDNFRRTVGYGFKGFKTFKTRRLDKGHNAEFKMFVDRVEQGGKSLIPLDQIVNVTLATFAARTSAVENRTINLQGEYAIAIGHG